MSCSRLLVVSCLMSAIRFGLSQEHKTLAQCSFDESDNCGFQIIPDLDGVHHRELWTLSPGGSLGRNCPPSDHTSGLNLDVFASSKSLDSTATHDFHNFTTKIISPEMNFTTGRGHISFYYFLWISADPERNEETYPSLNVKGCDGELMWTEMSFTSVWSLVEIDFPCTKPGKIIFEAFHRRPGSGVAIDDVKIIQIPYKPGGVVTRKPVPTSGMVFTRPPATSSIPEVPGGQTTVAMGHSAGHGDRIIIIVVGCFIGALLIFAVSITIHCYLWRKRKRANQRHLTDTPNGLHVSNTGYDFLTGIAGVNNGNGSRKSGATETTTLSTISKSIGGSSYQMDIVSEKRKGSGTFDKQSDGSQVPPKGKRRSISKVSFKRSRSGKEKSFEYSEMPDSTLPTTDENFYHFLTTPRKQATKSKTPKLGDIGRSAKMTRSNSLPSRNSVDSTTGTRTEGPYHITDLIGNITIDNAIFPSVETVAYDDLSMKRKESVKYDLPQLVPSGQSLPNSNNHEYKALEPRKRSNSYDVLQISTPTLISLSDESVGDNSHVYKELENQDDRGDYDLLDPITANDKAPRDLTDYDNPLPPTVSPKPISPFAPRPMSPRLNSQSPLPAVVPSEDVPKTVEGPDGFVVVCDPKYYTLVPDLVRDASYDYPDLVIGDDGDDTDDKASDVDSNIYESFERPITPKDKRQRSTPNSRQNSRQSSRQNSRQTSKEGSFDVSTPDVDNAAKKEKRSLIKQQQLAKFLDDDYENIE